MDKLKIKSEIDNARNMGKPILFKGILKDTPDWNYVMEYLNKKFNETPNYEGEWNTDNSFLKNKKNETVPLFNYNEFDIQAWYINLPECDQMYNIFSLNEKNVAERNFKILIDFLGTGKKMWPHKDYSEVYSWTWINSIEYRIYKDNNYKFEDAIDLQDETYESFVIESGDVLYMPKGIVHQAIINEPRVSLIVSTQ